MNYPVWDVPGLGAGLVVAIVAIIHVLISHLAVGGGAFLLVAELWAARARDREFGARVRAWLHRYATFFLVFTTVFGALTGVGIWFAIQLASPEGTSLLIHQFVFVWATEWLIFLVEFTTIYLYYYGWRTNSPRLQAFLAGAYFVAAWLSLFAINGILTFMLTPGGWTLANRSLAAAFFNPGFWPALGFRTVVMFLLAGLSGFLVAARIRGDAALKERLVLFAARWIVPAALLAPLFVLWYCTTLPAATWKLFAAGAAGLSGARLEALTRCFLLAAVCGGLLVLGTLVVAARPRALSTTAAVALLLVALLGILGGEFFRELSRKPYVVYGTLYSNSLWQADRARPEYLAQPLAAKARWLPPDAPPLSAARGEWVWRLSCASCHTRDGYRSLRTRTAGWTPEFALRRLTTLDEQGVMPPFGGTAEDRAALAAYLLALNGTLAGPDELRRLLATEATIPPASPGDESAQASPGAAGAVAVPPVPPPDPIGYPLAPWIVRAFAWLTLTLHFLAVHFTLGALALLLWLRRRGGAESAGPTAFLVAGLPLGLSYVINFGVPPLLFVQTLYGQLFYSSSVLLGAFWLQLVPLVMAAYAAFYYLRLARPDAAARPRRLGLLVPLGLAALGYVGFILVNNLTLAQTPDRWLEFYARHPGGGTLNWGEPTLFWRWLLFLGAAPAVAGLALIWRGTVLHRWGLAETGTASQRLGARAALLALLPLVAGAAGLALTLPGPVRALLGAGGAATALLGAWATLFALALLAGWRSVGRSGLAAPTLAAAALLGATGSLVVLRDLVRLEYLRPHLDLAAVPVHPQWGIFMLFVGSVVGGALFLALLAARVLPALLRARRAELTGGG